MGPLPFFSFEVLKTVFGYAPILLWVFQNNHVCYLEILFKKGGSEPVSCNLYGKTYKTCGNTTNLATHRKIKHHFAYLQLAKIAKSVLPLPTLLTSTNTQPASAKDNVDSIPVSSNISMMEFMDGSRVDVAVVV